MFRKIMAASQGASPEENEDNLSEDKLSAEDTDTLFVTPSPACSKVSGRCNGLKWHSLCLHVHAISLFISLLIDNCYVM